ncbi:hypothetical protein CR513_05328, partial [Mucuna pruriens]
YIQDLIELHHYHNLENLVHQATKVELQLKKPYPSDSGRGKERGGSRKDKNPRKGSETPKGRKEERIRTPSSSSRSSSNICFKCFSKGHIASQCPNKRTMVLRENGKVESESLHILVRLRAKGKISFTLDALCVGKLCSIIIDDRSSVNVASSKLVGKLGIPTLPHPKPYKLQ